MILAGVNLIVLIKRVAVAAFMCYNHWMYFEKIKERIHYPKLIALVSSMIAAYVLFQFGAFDMLPAIFHGKGYISLLIAGFFFAYGFTAPFAVAAFVAIAPDVNIFLGALLAGLGAFIADALIFKFIRSSFKDELDKLKLSAFMLWFKEKFDGHLGEEARKYLLWVFSGFLIASPLPDEFGVSLLGGFTELNQKVFYWLSYSLNTLGILLILLIAV